MADIVYHKYPKFAEALKNRAVEYNMSIRNIEKLEKAGEVFVIRPSVPLTIPRICKSAEEIGKDIPDRCHGREEDDGGSEKMAGNVRRIRRLTEQL